MVDEKGLEAEAADRIGEWVQMSGGEELVEKLLGKLKLKTLYCSTYWNIVMFSLTTGSKLAESAKAKAGLEDMALLLRYCNLYGCRSANHVCAHFTLSPFSAVTA